MAKLPTPLRDGAGGDLIPLVPSPVTGGER